MDDERAFLRVLLKRFERAGWQHRVLPGPVSVERLGAMKLNALIVDTTLLGPSAWDFLDRLGRTMPGLGLVVCTQGATVDQRVRGLRMGADDWINKPCHPEEAMARIEVAVRRRRSRGLEEGDTPVVAGELEIRPERFQAYVGGQSLEFTRREFEVLNLLAQNAGRVLEREEIYRRVWGYEMVHGDRSVDVFVRKVRSKLEQRSPGWDYIHTHVGIGYRFEPGSLQGVYELETAR